MTPERMPERIPERMPARRRDRFPRAWFPVTGAPTAAALAAVCAGVVACGTWDYGDAPVDEVEVSTTKPSWTYDVKPLMELKCMNCHTDKPGRFVPGDTPPISLDDEATFRARADRVEARVYKTPAKPMPPHFGTPLNDAERASLKKFLADLKASLPPPTPAPTADPSKPKVKYSEVSGLFTAACASAGCHASGQATPLSDLAEIKARRASIYALVSAGSMPPPSGPRKLTGDEKQKLLDWAQAGTDD